MVAWSMIALFGAGAGFLVARGVFRRSHQQAAAAAAGLSPAADLTHLPATLQQTALWTLTDGGFERRIVTGVVSRGAHDIEVTGFDLETLRDRRGEWVYLLVELLFRIGGVVSVVVCVVDRALPHILLKRAGGGDELRDDDALERAGHVAKAARATLGLTHAFAAELPATLTTQAVGAVAAPWRAYGDAAVLDDLLASGFAATLTQNDRRDLVVELLDTMVIVYPAALVVTGADAFADLTATAVAIAEGVLAGSRPLSPRGVEAQRPTD